MASILNVDQINNAAGTSGLTLDASTGKASFPNGATLPTGSVLQLKQNIYDTSTSISVSAVSATGYSMSGWFYTGVSLSFTPFSSSSRIILNSTINFSSTNHGERISFKIVRDTGSINPVTGMGAIDSNRRMCHSSSLYMSTGTDEHLNEISMYTYDEPSTTSAVTYKVYVNQNAGSGATVYINRPDTNHDAYYIPKAISTLTGFEVAQ